MTKRKMSYSQYQENYIKNKKSIRKKYKSLTEENYNSQKIMSEIANTDSLDSSKSINCDTKQSFWE